MSNHTQQIMQKLYNKKSAKIHSTCEFVKDSFTIKNILN